jgi:Fic family protein
MQFALNQINISHVMLKLVSNISIFEERFSNLPMERDWIERISEESIRKNAADSLILDKIINSADQVRRPEKIKTPAIRNRLLNEIEIRKSFPIYFKDHELNTEQVQYVHRFLDNLQDSASENRGKFRKSQSINEVNYFKELAGTMPRYGFVPRLLDELNKEINGSSIHEMILAPIIYADYILLSPFSRHNASVARIVSKGFLYSRGIDTHLLLNIDEYFVHRKNKYFNALNSYFAGEKKEWIELYLKAVLDAYKNLAIEIENESGGTVRPMENEAVALTKRQKTIIELLKKNNQMAGSEIAELLGVSRQNIFVIMQKLIDKSVVERVGKGTTSRYKLKVS